MRVLLLRGTIGAGKSSVAGWIGANRPGIRVIEVDEIKMMKYGTTDFCEPQADFAEAGRAARDALAAGQDAVVVEAFCDEEHVRLALGALSLEYASPQVSTVWLDCGVDTALARKSGLLSPEVIRFQHGRGASRFRVADERVIGTDALSIEQVARQILETTAFGGDSAS